MSESLLHPVVETSYLTVQNASRYRLIMRHFYRQHQRSRYWLRKEEVFEAVVATGFFPDYTIEQCEQDLEALRKWENLVAIHDGSNATSVEEYLRKRFRYEITQYSVEIERMLENLEKAKGYSGVLDPKRFDEIEWVLRELMGQGEWGPGTALELWERLVESFDRLVENGVDYLHHLQSARAEELMSTVQFLIYKDKLTEYLQKFVVQGLQRSGRRVQALLVKLDQSHVDKWIHAVARDYAEIPRLDEPLTMEDRLARVQDKWSAIVQWFLGSGYGEADIDLMEKEAKNTITRVVRYVARIQEKQRSGVSRRRELDYLGRWFLSLDSVEEAHKLAACVFGLYRTRHYQGADEKGSDNPDLSMWQVAPSIRVLSSRGRRRRESSGQPIISRKAEAAKADEVYLAKRAEEEQIVQSLVGRGRLIMSQLEYLPAPAMDYLLDWIGQCQSNESRHAHTPEGVLVKLFDPPASDSRRKSSSERGAKAKVRIS
ncbi:hypothetical protein SY88_10150 [Clostridiales bacterium PH28_bin88]|nr:hypothetical protein SY88_10150 [Clostridiales bacterium PH28_bin88]